MRKVTVVIALLLSVCASIAGAITEDNEQEVCFGTFLKRQVCVNRYAECLQAACNADRPAGGCGVIASGQYPGCDEAYADCLANITCEPVY